MPGCRPSYTPFAMLLRPLFIGFTLVTLLAFSANPGLEGEPGLVEIDVSHSFRCEAPFGAEPERVHFSQWTQELKRLIRLESQGKMGKEIEARCEFTDESYFCQWEFGGFIDLNVGSPQVKKVGEDSYQYILTGKVATSIFAKSQPVSCRVQSAN